MSYLQLSDIKTNWIIHKVKRLLSHHKHKASSPLEPANFPFLWWLGSCHRWHSIDAREVVSPYMSLFPERSQNKTIFYKMSAYNCFQSWSYILHHGVAKYPAPSSRSYRRSYKNRLSLHWWQTLIQQQHTWSFKIRCLLLPFDHLKGTLLPHCDRGRWKIAWVATLPPRPPEPRFLLERQS